MWVFLVVHFVQRAKSLTSENELANYPQNVGGLESFILGSVKRNSEASIDWRAIAVRHRKDEARDPIALDLPREQEERLRSANEDAKRHDLMSRKIAKLQAALRR